MKKTLFILMIGALCIPILAQDNQAGGLRYTIQARKFENKAGWRAQWDLGDAWGAVLTEKLASSGKFIVISEQDMRGESMDEQDFAQSGRAVNGKKSPKTGQMTTAQLLIKGNITQFDDGTSGGGGDVNLGRIRLGAGKSTALISGTVYVVDSTTGMVTSSKNFEAKLSKRRLKVGYTGHGWSGDLGGFKKTPAGKVMEMACEDVVKFLIQETKGIVWSGSIVKGGKDKIIVNRGSREGVEEGQILRVGKTEEIRDPDTGELLDNDFVETGTLRVTRVKEKLCYATLASGNPPRKGDTVYK